MTFSVILLAQNGDDIERGATGQSSRNQFDRFRTGSTSRIIQEQIVPAAGNAKRTASAA